MTILVTGSTGKLGTIAVKQLMRRVTADQIIAGARDVEKAAPLGRLGVRVRELDYYKPETFPAAFDKVTRIYLISGNDPNRVQGHKAVIEGAKAAGVKFIAYTSILHADTAKTVLAKDHLETEEALKASGLSYTILRNGWYFENYLDNLDTLLEHGSIFGATQDAKFSPARRADYADAAAMVLTNNGHVGKTYELAGDTAYSLSEIAAEIARITGKPLKYTDLPVEEYKALLTRAGLPDFAVNWLSDADLGVARGELFDESGELKNLVGRPTWTLTRQIEDTLKAKK